ncbi:MAG: vWA domain-containing protein, partial [Bacteroidota bacterium]
SGYRVWGATYIMVDHTADNAPANNQAIILFTDGKAGSSGVSLSEVTAHAVNRGVQVYTVGLSNDVELNVLAEIARETGGAFMWAADAEQLITMFGTLGDLLSGNALFYQTQWQAVLSAGAWTSGNSFVAEMVITLSNGEQFIVPFEVVVP